jgi:hypothetical protein
LAALAGAAVTVAGLTVEAAVAAAGVASAKRIVAANMALRITVPLRDNRSCEGHNGMRSG